MEIHRKVGRKNPGCRSILMRSWDAPQAWCEQSKPLTIPVRRFLWETRPESPMNSGSPRGSWIRVRVWTRSSPGVTETAGKAKTPRQHFRVRGSRHCFVLARVCSRNHFIHTLHGFYQTFPKLFTVQTPQKSTGSAFIAPELGTSQLQWSSRRQIVLWK